MWYSVGGRDAFLESDSSIYEGIPNFLGASNHWQLLGSEDRHKQTI